MPDLIILHGPPTSGKFTIASELSALTKVRVFHNHLTLDVAKSLLEFGAPEFWRLVHDLRLLSLRYHFEHGCDTAVTTWCYEESVDYAMFVAIKQLASSAGGQVLPVYLHCDLPHLVSRVDNEHRQKMKKLCDPDRLTEIMAEKNYCAIPDEMCLELNTNTTSPAENARNILENFKL